MFVWWVRVVQKLNVKFDNRISTYFQHAVLGYNLSTEKILNFFFLILYPHFS